MWVIFTSFVFLPAIINCQHRDTYTAAVVEYFPIKNYTLGPTTRIIQNVAEYLDVLKNIEEDVDIVVFPEATLTSGARLFKRDVLLESSAVFPSQTEIPPCKSEEYAQFIKLLSCGARQHKTYVSVNLIEKEKCKKEICKHEDKWNVYNTNVVFNRKGNIVAKYRKYNLFGEKEMDSTDKPERVTFTTDFNVTFGVFICFDIMFEDPAQKLVNSGVKHFIYPNMWFSELNQLTSLQTHGMWAYANDVVLLSAGANNPKRASGGSGIFQGRLGAVEAYISGVEGTKVLIQKVKKNWSADDGSGNVCYNKPSMTNFTFWNENYKNFSSELLDVHKPKQTLCSNGACCSFEIDATEKRSKASNEYTYHVAMISGYKHINSASLDLHVESCIVMACISADISTCGKRFVDDVNEDSFPLTFHNITVSIEEAENDNAYHYPNSLTGEFVPLSVDEFIWSEKSLPGKKLKKSVTLREKRDDIFTFGIFGRIFNDPTL